MFPEQNNISNKYLDKMNINVLLIKKVHCLTLITKSPQNGYKINLILYIVNIMLVFRKLMM